MAPQKRPAGPQTRIAASRPGPPPAPVARPRRRRTLLYVLLAAAAAVGGGAVLFITARPEAPAGARAEAGTSSIPRDPRLNVVLFTLDTTRADRLGCYGYALGRTPSLDILARDGVRFDKAYSQVPLTLPSHASIMTGQYPYAHGVHNNGSYVLGPGPATLAQVFRDRGYRTAAFTASFSVDSRFGLGRGFEVYDDHIQADAPFKSANAERKAEEVYKAFLPWLEKAAAGDRPFFVWIHFFDPHLPYNPPSPFREECGGRLYDGEVSYMDAVFGMIMGRLMDRKMLSKTLVVAAGDHGESFGEKGESGHGLFLYEPAVHVPLILFAEGRLPAGTVVPSRVRLIDIMPTILDLAGAPIPASVQGRSLVPYIEKKKTDDLDNVLETFYPRENFGWAALTGLMSERWKYIHAPTEELYDLRADPGEESNAAAGNRTAAALKTKLEAALKSAAGTTSTGRTLSEAEKAKLRSLGYVDYSDPKSRDAAADPKDHLAELKMVQDAEKFEYEGRFAEAAQLHARMLALRPGAPSSYINLALALARLKRFDEAVATLKKGLGTVSDAEPLLTRLGFTYLVMNRPQEALAAMADVLKLNPRSVDALTASGIILEGLKRKDEARGYLERALGVEPENKFVRTALAGNLAGQGRLAEAIPFYVRLVEDFPGDPALHRLLGYAYSLSGQTDRAVETFRKWAVLAPSPEAYFNLGIAAAQKGAKAEAAEALRKYLADPKGEPQARIDQARRELLRLKPPRP